MQAAVQTEPLGFSHPRAAQVSVLAARGVEVSELTTGTLIFRSTSAQVASVDLRVDHSFVSVAVPRVFGVEHLQEALQGSVPDGYLVLGSMSGEALIITFVRAFERSLVPELFCTSLDARLRVRTAGGNDLVLRGTAKGRSELLLRVGEAIYRLKLTAGETALQVSFRVREVLAAEHTCLIAPHANGDTTVTLLPRR